MDWLERLNRHAGRLPLGQGTADVLGWAYDRHLADNRPHRHTFFEVCLVGAHGQGLFTVQDRAHPIGPGDVFAARPGVVHQIQNTGKPDMELTWVSFGWTPGQKSDGDADRLLQAFAESSTLVVPDAGGRLAALWRVLRAVAEGEPGRAFAVQYHALVSALLLGLAEVGSDPAPGPPPDAPTSDPSEYAARLAIRFIHDNLSRPLPLPEIAAQVHLSPRHLGRLVRRFTGLPPAQYIARARLDRARALLLHSSLPIKEVAAEAGYPDVHHFSRVFAAHVGRPPAAFRRDPALGHVPNIQKPGDLV